MGGSWQATQCTASQVTVKLICWPSHRKSLVTHEAEAKSSSRKDFESRTSKNLRVEKYSKNIYRII